MRYALISDLHANLQAWNAIHLDLRSNGVDYTICLGDLVGYGPNPAEVLQAVHAQVDALVLGNHDAAVCGKLDPSHFNDAAQESIRWTRAQLGANAVRFLGTLPLTLVGVDFRCAHGEFCEPGRFDYVLAAEDAVPSWNAVDARLLFVGHTHDPALFLLGPSGTPRTVEVQDFAIEDGKRYFVNVGSVGHPRDRDPRASYCIYDTTAQAVFWRRVPFDLDAYRAAMRQAGLDPATCYFLNHDPRRNRPPVRELLSFSPPRGQGEATRNVVQVQDLATWRKRARNWRNVAAALLLGTLCAGGLGLSAAWRYQTRALTLAALPVPAVAPSPGINLLPLPDHPVAAGQACPGWTFTLGDRRAQHIAVSLDESGHPVFALESETLREELVMAAPALEVRPGARFTPEALFFKSPDFDGELAIVMSLTRQGEQGEETIDRFYVKEPKRNGTSGWLRARQKFEIPARGVRIRFQIRGRFRGTVKIRELSLVGSPRE